MKKKLLFISYFLPPFNSPQSIQIGRILKYLSFNKNYEIHVVSANILNINKDHELYPDIFDNIEKLIYINDIQMNKYKKFILNKLYPKYLQLPDEFSKWHKQAYTKIVNSYDENFFDNILTFSFPLSTNILGLKLKEKFKTNWICHNSDPWAGNHFNNFNHTINNKNLDLEFKCFNKADKLLFTSDETAEFYIKRYNEFKNKINVLNHSFDKDLYPSLSKKNNSKKIMIRYIGGFYGQRTPEPMYKAIDFMIKNEIKINFIFEIYGFGRSIKNLMKKYNVSKIVEYKGGVNYLKSLELMKSSDFLILIDAPSNNKSIFFPSKLVDYLGSNRQVIVISPEGTCKRISEENNLFYFDLDETDKLVNFLINIKNNKLDNKSNQKYSIKTNLINLERLIN